LREVLQELPSPRGPVLDLYCGTQPYRELVPWRPLWGIDIDRHFGRADVLGRGWIPLRDASLGAVLCTQALHLLDDPALAVAEMLRVLRPSGFAIVTVPTLFRRDVPWERKWGPGELRELFREWGEIEIRGVGGVGTGAAYAVGHLLAAAARRARLEAALPFFALPLNCLGLALEAATRPLPTRWPATLTLIARREPG